MKSPIYTRCKAASPGVAMALMTALSLPAAPTSPTAASINIGSRLEPFVDTYLIESCRGAHLQLHAPRDAGTVLMFDQPWEGNTCDYVTVFKDGDNYRMYYRGSSETSYLVKSALRPEERVVPAHPKVTCCAESRDGIVWTRPSIGLHRFGGSTENNIVWVGEASESFGAFKDENPAALPAQRYKGVGIGRSGERRVLMGFFSGDGKRWEKLQEGPILEDPSPAAFDTLCSVFWDSWRGCYAMTYRDSDHGVRTLKYSTSKDFINWTPGRFADFGRAPTEHLYTNGAVPYFRSPQLYLAMPRRFLPWRVHFNEIGAKLPGISDAVFMSSRDGVHWLRYEDSFVRPGLDERNWATRNNTPAYGILPTGSDEISIYIVRNFTFPSVHLERLTLRTDGFVSVHAGHKAGEFVTRPLTFSGSKLILNYSTSANGSLRLEFLNSGGEPVSGFRLEDSPLLFGDSVAQEISWHRPEGETDRNPLARLAGMPIRLRVVLQDADLYSLRFQ